MKTTTAVAVAVLFALAGCSSDEALPAADADDEAERTTQSVDPGDVGEPSSQGSISLTIGDETWDFAGAQCASANGTPGQPAAEWNVSSISGDLQVYVSVDDFGPRVSLSDIADVGAMEWVAEGDAVTIAVDGDTVTASGTFTDLTGAEQAGTLAATCSSWAEAAG